MSVPDYESLMLPVLQAVADGEPHPAAEVRALLAADLGLSEEALAQRLPSGSPIFNSRVHWAVTYMAQAELIRRPRRGVMQITDRGRQVLGQGHERIDGAVLSQFPEFLEFKMRVRQREGDQTPSTTSATSVSSPAHRTPREQLVTAVEEANSAVASELLDRVRERDPSFLEQLVLRLLTAMGYGGRAGAAEHLGRGGDQGLDGVIRQDALGLDRVYVQAKRYGTDHAVGRPEIQAFVGALHGAQADRGVFISTSRFTAEARDYADRVPARLVLIDGQRLSELMVLHNIGVQDEESFTLKRIDEDFFDSF
ncbi:restriction endonuclease [Geodermatophilus sp. SYSU D00703]